MAIQAIKPQFRNSEWLIRFANGYKVKVPTGGGHKNFPLTEYNNSSEKAYSHALKFQKKMIKQLERDKKHFIDTGEKITHKCLSINNNSGHTGVHSITIPNRFSAPLILWIASWTNAAGKICTKRYSTANPNIKNQYHAKALAIAMRKEKHTKKF